MDRQQPKAASTSAAEDGKEVPLYRPLVILGNGDLRHPFARLAISDAVSRLMSGQHEMKISVPWTVPITCRQRACTPFCIRNRKKLMPSSRNGSHSLTLITT